MKKILLMLVCLAVLWTLPGIAADKTISTGTPTIGWDAVAVPGTLPATSTISYDYGYKLSPATIPAAIGNVSALSVKYSLLSYGIYVFCVRSVLKDQGVIVASSEWGCSDTAANCQGGLTFVDSFWPKMPTPGNLALPTMP